MNLALNLPPELAQYLLQEAQQRSLSVEQVVLQLLEQAVKIPNQVTEDTFNATDAGENLVRCDNADEMFQLLNI
ncbi:MAG: hypothetical protein ACO3NK_04580 [Prochlorotrichaceae cyanobacterium]